MTKDEATAGVRVSDLGKPAGVALIVLAGAATMFIELTLIRYVPGQIRVLGYFTNFVLLAAFLGFGVGMIVARRWPALPTPSRTAPLALLCLVGLVELGRVFRVIPSADDFLFLEYQSGGAEVAIYVFLAVGYVLLALTMVPVGHVVGRTLAGDRPLLRYGLNVAGSLAGIGLFVIVSACGAPPWLWVLLSAMLAAVGLAGAPGAWKAAGIAAMALAPLWAWHATRGASWSPYHKISIAPLPLDPEKGVVQEWKLRKLPPEARARVRMLEPEEGFVVRVNDDSYQTPVDLSDAALKKRPGLRALRAQYDVPFQGRAGGPGEVLVLGAGTGNDVAAALRAGATRVDAVEIDPDILELGRLHPEKPYADPRVTTFVTDARTFLARTQRRYDFIVFGLLDSHILMSPKSSVRLDSFVFTRESFALAGGRLKQDGAVVVSHAVGQGWFVDRMRATLAAAFGRPPIVVSDHVYHPLGFVYAAGPRVPAGRAVPPGVRVLEDDWPFVYLRAPRIPSEYVYAMLLMGLLSILAVRAASGRQRGGFRLSFFALGAGFLLLETRSLTVLAVLAGSTWGVTSGVFAGVLVMALLATAAGAKLAKGGRAGARWAAYAVLGGALALNFAVPVSSLAALGLPLRILLGVLLVSLPLFASGVIYALGLAADGQADRALASNLLGALLGGLVEYVSLMTGLRFLLVLAAGFYLLALLAGRRAEPLLPASRGKGQPISENP